MLVGVGAIASYSTVLYCIVSSVAVDMDICLLMLLTICTD